MSEILAIGDLRFPLSEIAFDVKYVSKRKLTEKVADGDDDATAVDGGREVRTITLKVTWPDRTDVNVRAAVIVQTLDPSAKDMGSPPPWAHTRNGLDLAALKNVRNVIVKEAKGPDTDPATRVTTYEVTLDSWSKTTKKTAKTEAGKKFVLGSELPVKGFGGNNNTIGGIPPPPAPKRPVVKP